VAKDRYRYFRIEARELLESLHRGLLTLTGEEGEEEQVRALLRHAHTLKGAARVVGQAEIGDLAHSIEGALSPFRERDGGVERAIVDEALAILDEMRVLLAALDAPATAAAPAAASERPAPDADLPMVRIHMAEMDSLLEGIEAAAASVARARRGFQQLDEAASYARGLAAALERGRGLGSVQKVEDLLAALEDGREQILNGVEAATSLLGEVRRAAADLRLIAADTLITELQQTVRDVATALGKQVEFQASGVNTRIDAHALAGLRTALRQIVRNAVAHGIEDNAKRSAAGKPVAGTVEIAIERRGHRVAIACRDDGAGIDTDAVRRVLVERRLASPSEVRTLDLDELTELLLRGGISTAAELTGVSGRGVGLDVVRSTIAGLRGEVTIRTVPGEGTTVELVVPVSLSTLPALEIEEGGFTAFVPIDSVRRAVSLKPEDVSRTADGERIVVDGTAIPFVPLRRALGWPARPTDGNGVQTAVVLHAGGQGAALGVDRLRGVDNVLVRSLPAHLTVDPVVAGAAVSEESAPALVLAPGPLVEAALRSGPGLEVEPAASPPRLLVIDDSLTTRMLEQSILESAGYEVDLAVSAEEALEKARARRYAVFIVDIEMPGMNGFEFIAQTRREAKLREVPAILVTSRADPEDKRRGKDVGARAYIVKSEFDQQDLLETIRRLV
jgi:two-component system chemotaxis sensor kinase CheA